MHKTGTLFCLKRFKNISFILLLELDSSKDLKFANFEATKVLVDDSTSTSECIDNILKSFHATSSGIPFRENSAELFSVVSNEDRIISLLEITSLRIARLCRVVSQLVSFSSRRISN